MLYKSKKYDYTKSQHITNNVSKNTFRQNSQLPTKHINKMSQIEKNPFREKEMKMCINYNYKRHGQQIQPLKSSDDVGNNDNEKIHRNKDNIRYNGKLTNGNIEQRVQQITNGRKESSSENEDDVFHEREDDAGEETDSVGQSILSVGANSLTGVGELIPRKVEFVKYLHMHNIIYPAGAMILNPKHTSGIKRSRDGDVENDDDSPIKKVITAHVCHRKRTNHPDDCEGDPRHKEIPSVLFPINSLSRIVFVRWQEVGNGYGGGLVNYGNTCFANAILQCFAFTPTIAQFFLKFGRSSAAAADCINGGHRNGILSGSYDYATAVSEVIYNIHQTRGRVYKPGPIVGYLSGIRKGFRIGQQSDAHEFAQCLIGKCQQIYVERLGKGKKIIPVVGNTSPLMRVIGGYIRSQVSWSKQEEISVLRGNGSKSIMLSAAMDLEMDVKLKNRDRLVSNVYDMFTMLNLSIPGKGLPGYRGGTITIESCVAEFFSKEKLKGRVYTTPRQVQVHAYKQFSLHILPPTLILHLKRFDNNGSKINKYVSFSHTLDMLPYCSSNSDIKEAKYQLCGVTVHEGNTVDYGHYYAYVKGKNQLWYCCDDSSVRHVGIDQVMGCQSYMLFYTLTESSFAKQLNLITDPVTVGNAREEPKKHRSPLRPVVSAPHDIVDTGAEITESDVERIMLLRKQHEADVNQQNSHVQPAKGEAERQQFKIEKAGEDIETESDEEESPGKDDVEYSGMTSSFSTNGKDVMLNYNHHSSNDPEVDKCVSPTTPTEFTVSNFTSLFGDEGQSDINNDYNLEKLNNDAYIESNEWKGDNYNNDEDNDKDLSETVSVAMKLKKLRLERKETNCRQIPMLQPTSYAASDNEPARISPSKEEHIKITSSSVVPAIKLSVLPTMNMTRYGNLVKSIVKYSAPDRTHSNEEKNGYASQGSEHKVSVTIRGSIHDVIHSEESDKGVTHHRTLERKKHHGSFHKHQRDETYAREIDKGKVKKIVRRVSDEEKFCAPNMFQLAANQSKKNKNRISFSEDIVRR